MGKIIGKGLQNMFGASGVGNEKPIFARAIGVVYAETLPAPTKIQPAFACNGVGEIACWQRGQAQNVPQKTARAVAAGQAEKMARAVVHDVV